MCAGEGRDAVLHTVLSRNVLRQLCVQRMHVSCVHVCLIWLSNEYVCVYVCLASVILVDDKYSMIKLDREEYSEQKSGFRYEIYVKV